MNTRLQVEHPITEMVTGVDLVQWQIRIARGERLDLDPARAADAARPRDRVPHLRRGSRQRLPAVARAASCSCASPAGPGIRDDSGADAGLDVPIFYDPMISKLIAWARGSPARDRAHAARARRIPGRRHQDDAAVLHAGCSRSRSSSTGDFHTTYLDEVLQARNGAAVRRAGAGRRGDRGDRRRAAGGVVAAAIAGSPAANGRGRPISERCHGRG